MRLSSLLSTLALSSYLGETRSAATPALEIPDKVSRDVLGAVDNKGGLPPLGDNREIHRVSEGEVIDGESSLLYPIIGTVAATAAATAVYFYTQSRKDESKNSFIGNLVTQQGDKEKEIEPNNPQKEIEKPLMAQEPAKEKEIEPNTPQEEIEKPLMAQEPAKDSFESDYKLIEYKDELFDYLKSSKPFDGFPEDDKYKNLKNKLTTQFYHRRNRHVDSISEITEIPQPTNALMKKITEHYQKKYDVEILVMTILEFEVAIKDFSNLKKPLGIILTSDSCEGHVVPILLNTKSGDLQALKLDVLVHEESIKFPFIEKATALLKEHKFKVFSTDETRQADVHSCRTEATSILRNILLYIRKESITDFSHFSKEDSHVKEDGIIAPGGSSSRFIEIYQDIAVCSLPPEVTYIDQIVSKTLDMESAEIVRGQRKETAADFQRRYTKELTFFSELISGTGVLGNTVPEGEVLSYFSDENQEAKIEKGGSKAILSTKRVQRANVYLVVKAFKNALKHTRGELKIPAIIADLIPSK